MMDIKERKRKTKEPCQGCFLHPERCMCHLIPNLETKTKLSLIIHHRELKRTTNTGRLAINSLQNSKMFIRGLKDSPLSLENLIQPNEQAFLLFPSEDALELTPEFLNDFQAPFHLIVPDGNWRQASKVNSRYPELENIPRVIIRRETVDEKFLRAESTEDGMATLQAIAMAFSVLEDEQTGQQLMQVYREKLNRTIEARGL